MPRLVCKAPVWSLFVFWLTLGTAVAGMRPPAAAIATAHPLATEAGLAVLEAGGNAFDAAVAVSAALAVVEPYGSGLGGGGFWLLHRVRDGREVMIDGRERAPLDASADMYLDDDGEVITGASIDGPLAAGIPGVPAALGHIAEHYGRLPLAISLGPAIVLAREGFPVDPVFRRLAQFRIEALRANDRFAAIAVAVRLGRSIFGNIRKFVVYLLSCNISEILVVTLATVAGAPLPLLPLQILFLNLVTDVFPALALGVGPARPGLMSEKPRPASERILPRRQWAQIGLYGVVIAIATLAAMAYVVVALGFSADRAVTVAFCTIALAQLWHVFNMRGDIRRVFINEITRNPWVWAALALCLVLVLMAVYVPVLNDVLRLADPGPAGWSVVAVASIVPLLAAPAVRFFARRL